MKSILAEHIKGILNWLGVETTDPNFKETPLRVERAYREFFLPEEQIQENLEKYKKSFPSEGYNSIVFFGLIHVTSFCPHHLLPVKYTIDCAYLSAPDGNVIGASKPARMAETLAKLPMLQETFTAKLAITIQEATKALGVGVLVKGEHDCMKIRGIKQMDSVMITNILLGIFREDAKVKQEFFEMVKHSRR